MRAQRLDAFRDLVALSSLERVEDAYLRSTQQKMTVDKSKRFAFVLHCLFLSLLVACWCQVRARADSYVAGLSF